MAFWLLLSFIIQLLLRLGQTQNLNDTDTNTTQASMPMDYLTLEYALEFQSLENIIGATFHDNYLLVYSENLLTILDLSQNTTQKPIIKFLQGFQPKKLVSGFNDTTLLLLTQGQHCVKELTFANREISTLSGKCDESGFVDGEADKARYNVPSDLAKSGNHFFIADYNNDCIRRLWSDGFAQIVLTIHSKPFALSGNLYVAARQTVYEVRESMNTYVRFVADVNVTSLDSCSQDVLSMLTVDKCLHLLPLSRDVSHQPKVINSSFNGVMCRDRTTYISKVIPLEGEANYVTMQISSVDVRAAVGMEPTTIPPSTTSTTPTTTPTATPALSNTPSVTTVTINTSPPSPETPPTMPPTPSPPSTTVFNHFAVHPTTGTTPPARTPSTVAAHIPVVPGNNNLTYLERQGNTSKLVVTSQLKDTTDSKPSSQSSTQLFGSSTRPNIIPLHNHAHEQFPHLPEGYTEHNGEWNVILPVALAVFTVFLVLVVFACIVYKRSKKRQMHKLQEEDAEELCNYGELTENLISDHNSSSCCSDSDYRSSSPNSSHIIPPNIRVVDIVTKDQPALRNGDVYSTNRNMHVKVNGTVAYPDCNGRANDQMFSYPKGIARPSPRQNNSVDQPV